MMNEKTKELMLFVNKWKKLNNKMREVNKYLYEHTELFERTYMFEYNEELFHFFAKKITRYAKEENELNQILGYELNELSKKYGLLED